MTSTSLLGPGGGGLKQWRAPKSPAVVAGIEVAPQELCRTKNIDRAV
jgi:hypothetical protein